MSEPDGDISTLEPTKENCVRVWNRADDCTAFWVRAFQHGGPSARRLAMTRLLDAGLFRQTAHETLQLSTSPIHRLAACHALHSIGPTMDDAAILAQCLPIELNPQVAQALRALLVSLKFSDPAQTREWATHQLDNIPRPEVHERLDLDKLGPISWVGGPQLTRDECLKLITLISWDDGSHDMRWLVRLTGALEAEERLWWSRWFVYLWREPQAWGPAEYPMWILNQLAWFGGDGGIDTLRSLAKDTDTPHHIAEYRILCITALARHDEREATALALDVLYSAPLNSRRHDTMSDHFHTMATVQGKEWSELVDSIYPDWLAFTFERLEGGALADFFEEAMVMAHPLETTWVRGPQNHDESHVMDIIESLVWRTTDGTLFRFQNGEAFDHDYDPVDLTDSTHLTIAHPLDMGDELVRWADHMAEDEVHQPFDLFQRRLSTREHEPINNVLNERGILLTNFRFSIDSRFKFGERGGPFELIYPHRQQRALLNMELYWTMEESALTSVRFVDFWGEPLDDEDVDPVVYSETLRTIHSVLARNQGDP